MKNTYIVRPLFLALSIVAVTSATLWACDVNEAFEAMVDAEQALTTHQDYDAASDRWTEWRDKGQEANSLWFFYNNNPGEIPPGVNMTALQDALFESATHLQSAQGGLQDCRLSNPSSVNSCRLSSHSSEIMGAASPPFFFAFTQTGGLIAAPLDPR